MAKPVEMFDEAQRAARGGDIGEAKRLYKAIIENHYGSEAADPAVRELARLEQGDAPQPAAPKAPEPRREASPIQRVTVVDVEIKFATMVSLIIKFVIALIPAAIILAFLVIVVLAMLGRLPQL